MLEQAPPVLRLGVWILVAGNTPRHLDRAELTTPQVALLASLLRVLTRQWKTGVAVVVKAHLALEL